MDKMCGCKGGLCFCFLDFCSSRLAMSTNGLSDLNYHGVGAAGKMKLKSLLEERTESVVQALRSAVGPVSEAMPEELRISAWSKAGKVKDLLPLPHAWGGPVQKSYTLGHRALTRHRASPEVFDMFDDISANINMKTLMLAGGLPSSTVWNLRAGTSRPLRRSAGRRVQRGLLAELSQPTNVELGDGHVPDQ